MGIVPGPAAWPVWRRHLTTYRRVWVSNLLGHLADPLFYLAVLGYGLGALMPPVQGTSYPVFLITGIVAGAAMSSACFECSYGSFLRMHNQGTFDAMLATPVSVADLAAGEAAWAAAKGLIAAVATLLVGVGFGLLDPGWWVLAALAAVGVQGIFFGGVALAVTCRVDSLEGLNRFYALFIMPALFLSGVFFPLDGLPPALTWLAMANPLTHTVHLVRPLAAGSVPESWWLEVIFLLTAAVLGFVVGAKSLRRRMVI